MTRKTIDCRDSPSASGCTLSLCGEEKEVEEAAVLHASTVHGQKDSPELRKMIRSLSKDEPAFGSEKTTEKKYSGGEKELRQ